MALTEEHIKEVLERNIQTKTKLVSVLDLEKTIKENEADGWKLINKIEINGRYKVTFQKVTKA